MRENGFTLKKMQEADDKLQNVVRVFMKMRHLHTKWWFSETRVIYIRRSISSTENDINMREAKKWTAINSFSILWKSALSDTSHGC